MPVILATKPELAVKGALDQLGEYYEFQSKMLGGRQVKGGTIADFWLPQYSLVITVIGEYWHYNRPDTIARDKLQQLALEGRGRRVVRIDATDALRNARFYVEQAILGIDHSREARY